MTASRVAVILALLVLGLAGSAAAASPVQPGRYRGVEYDKGHRTNFISMTLTVSPDGRYLQKLAGTVHARCDPGVAGGIPYSQDFSLGYPSRKRIDAQGRLNARYDAVTHASGLVVHRTLTLSGTLRGDRIVNGKLAFQSYSPGQGPGCSYDATWRGTRS